MGEGHLADSLDEILDDHITALKYASPSGQKKMIKGLIEHSFRTGFVVGNGYVDLSHEDAALVDQCWREYDHAPPFKENT